MRDITFIPGLNSKLEGFDADDVYGKFQQKKKRRVEHDVPDWTHSDAEVMQVIFRSFPLLKKDGLLDKLVEARAQKRKRKNARTPHDKYFARAVLWLTVIERYFRAGKSRTDIAHELGITPDAVGSLIRNILRAGDGLRTSGAERKPRPTKYKKSLRNEISTDSKDLTGRIL